MLVPCEIAAKCALPCIRAMVAKELMTKYGLKQVEAAEALGVSQPAISLYTRKLRGRAIDLEHDVDILKLADQLAASLAKHDLPHRDFIIIFCEICRTIRAKGFLCKMHETLDPSVNVDECKLCLETGLLKCL